MGPEGRRILSLRDKTNDELFRLYTDDLTLRLHNEKNLRDTKTLLMHFQDHLSVEKPSREAAKAFLAQYAKRKARTLYRYTQVIKAFMNWYGEPLEDIRVRVPKSLPSYTEDADIEKLLESIGKKQSHKHNIGRDQLLVEVALRTGMRRGELANLHKKDIHVDFLIVREGKGIKDRMIPLIPDVAAKLANFTQDMTPEQRVFGLGGPAIGMKIKKYASRAGIKDFHTHSLRHKYATDLLESGANIKVVQALLGHENLNTTQVYLSITEKSLYEAVVKLDKHINSQEPKNENTITLSVEKKTNDIYLRSDEDSKAVVSLEKHWEDLAHVAGQLINDFRLIRKYKDLGEEIIREIWLDKTEQEQLQTRDYFLSRCLLQHLQSEFPRIAWANSWSQLRLNEITEEIIDALSAIAWGRIPSGTCSICNST
jgi:site-specific recombinase XerD